MTIEEIEEMKSELEELRRFVLDLTAKLEAVKPRPIEEAPKDGGPVLALWDGRWVETYWAKRDKFEGWQMPSGMVVKAYAPDTWNPTRFIPISALTVLENKMMNELEKTLLAHNLQTAGGSVASPKCCGVPMADDGGCSEGCCDDYKCNTCGKTVRVEWPD